MVGRSARLCAVLLGAPRSRSTNPTIHPDARPTVQTNGWIVGPSAARQRYLDAANDLPVLTARAHRRLGGPYTAGGQIARAITPLLFAHAPELLQSHEIELLSLAPDLDHVVPRTRETLDTLSGVSERTRLFPAERTRWLAHGVADMLQEWSSRTGPLTLIIDEIDQADPTDAQLLAVLLRRLRGSGVSMIVGSATVEVAHELGAALGAHAQRKILRNASPRTHLRDDLDGARRYVDSDGTIEDPTIVRAWAELDDEVRHRLHDDRADYLEVHGGFPARLGAIPFHRMHGSDRAGAGLDVVHRALECCLLAGHFDAAIELARMEYGELDWANDPRRCWAVGSKLCAALVGLGRVDEAAQVYLEARVRTTDPQIQMQSAYGEALLRTRHFDPARRDHRKAKAWLQTALTIAGLLPDAEDRAVAQTFYSNALALVEVHLGHPEAALRLVSEGRERLDKALEDDQWRLHRSVLGHNLARVYSQLGALDAALVEYDRAVATDSCYPDYYLERGNVRRRLGDSRGALADYTRAIDVGLPCPQATYNRGDLELELGHLDAARRDFDRTLELDDSYVDAWLNRASVHLTTGALADAAADISAGLERDPGNGHLYCLRGTVAAAHGDDDGAAADFFRALELEPNLAAAWANLAVLNWGAGRLEEALTYFDRSLELDDDADVRANREVALSSRRGSGQRSGSPIT